MNFPQWTIIPNDSDTCSREKLLETLKIADKIIHAYVMLNGHEKMIEVMDESRITTKEE